MSFRKRNCGATERVHVGEAIIQFTFTSLALAFECVAARSTVRRKRVSENLEEIDMNGTKVLGLAAMGAFLVMAAPVEHARAVSLINPGAAGTLQEGSRQLTTEVHWHHHWHHRHWGWLGCRVQDRITQSSQRG